MRPATSWHHRTIHRGRGRAHLASRWLSPISMEFWPKVGLKEKSPPTELQLFSDSQAAIQAVQNPKRSSGQYVLLSTYHHVRAIRSRMPTSLSFRIKIHWITAQMGVMGNKAAGEAKLAADTGDCGAEQPDCGGNSAGGVGMELIRLAFTAKRDMRTRFKARRAKQWVDD